MRRSNARGRLIRAAGLTLLIASMAASGGRDSARLAPSHPAAPPGGPSPPSVGLEVPSGSEREVTGAGKLEEIRTLIKQEGKYGEAEKLAREILAGIADDERESSKLAGQVLDLLVEALWRGGKVGEAGTRKLAEEAVRIKTRMYGREDPEVARSLKNLAIIMDESGDYTAAKPLFERCLEIRSRSLGPDHPDVASALANLAVALWHMGDFAGAKERYLRALAVREKVRGPWHPDIAQSLNNLAILDRDIGEEAAARPLLERAVAIWERNFGPEHPDTLTGESNLADLLADMGDAVAARRLQEHVMTVREKVLGPDHFLVATSACRLARILTDLGDRARALKLYDLALEIQERALGPLHVDVAETLYGRARLLAESDPGAAKPLYDRALNIWRRSLGAGYVKVALALQGLGEIRLRGGDPGGAKLYYMRAMGIFEESLGPSHPEVAHSLNDLAAVSRAAGDPLRAIEQSLRAEAIVRDHFRRTARGLSEREALRYEEIRASGLDRAISILTQAGLSGPSPDLTTRVFDQVIRSRAMVLDEIARRHRTVLETEDPALLPLEEELRAAGNRLARLVVRGPDVDRPASYRADVERAVVEKESAERALAARSAGFRDELSERRIGLSRIKEVLPDGSALIAYLRYGRRLHPGDEPVSHYAVFVQRAGSAAPLLMTLGPAREIDEAVTTWRQLASRVPAKMEGILEIRRAGLALRKAIWDPLSPHLEGARSVFVVPDGMLHLVNLSALPAAGDRFLVETGPVIHYLSAERDLARDHKARRKGGGLLVIGGPDFEARPSGTAGIEGAVIEPAALPTEQHYRGDVLSPGPGTGACGEFQSLRFQSLPGAEAEANDVEAQWRSASRRGLVEPQALSLTGRRASEEGFKMLAHGRRVIHLATHGFFVRERCAASPRAGLQSGSTAGGALLLSGMALAGANRRNDPEAERSVDDGIMTSEEVASLDLRGVEWVVLSACETGVGEVRTGEGVLGLRRAFEIAGAGTLIMSLWPIPDQAAAGWIHALYQGRLDGLSTAEAVRTASLKMIDGSRRAGVVPLPASWGAFVATGDWR